MFWFDAESDKKIVILSLFTPHSQKKQRATFVTEVFDSIESDEMTALWPSDSLTCTFYVISSTSITNWKSF